MLLENIISEKGFQLLDNVKACIEDLEECKKSYEGHVKWCVEQDTVDLYEEIYLEDIHFGNPNDDTDDDLPF
tara:strand:+ start:301 stop:516 length:216 start_codon:yes stop_codon:yes gene_type:complete